MPAHDGLGPWVVDDCEGLEAATAQLAGQSFAAVVFALAEADTLRLPNWPALAQVVAESAVLVCCAAEPGIDFATRLVRLGVQDVLGPGAPIAAALRLAVERQALLRSTRKGLGTDLLTGLPDQAQLTEQMSQLLAMREREPAPMALLAVRIDGVASAEARFGREAANALRRKIAVRLRAGLRAGDVVAALGPDLLGVLLSRVQDPQDADRVAGKLVQALKAPYLMAGGEVAVGVAIGAAGYPQDGRDATVLLRRATGLAAAATAVGRGSGAAANDAG